MTSAVDIRPHDFDDYWAAVLDELEAVPPAAEIEAIPLRTTEFATMYGVRLTSVGPYRLFAYLSIPVGEPPFPAIYYPPRYSSVMDPIPQGAPNALRSRYVTMSITARGQRNADRPFAASFPGMLTEGISDPSTYIYRGAVADCCRGIEYLAGRSEVDPLRVVASGNDMTIITAGLTRYITHVVCQPELFYQTMEMLSDSPGYPLAEIGDLLRRSPSLAGRIRRSLSYLDLRWFAPKCTATVLIMGGAKGEPLNRQTLHPLVEALEGGVDVHETEHSSYKDGKFVLEWLAQQTGFDSPILPEHW